MKIGLKTIRTRHDAHPSNLALEEFASDESNHDVTEHIARCALCRSYVVELVIAVYAGRAWQDAADSASIVAPS